MLLNPLREFSREAITASKLDDASISWHNTVFTVRTSKEIHIFEFSYDLNCMDKKVDFNRSSIPTPKESPATYLLSNNFIRYGVSNFELTQLIIDPSLWPHSAQIVQEMTCAIDCKWLPNLYFKREPLLAVLNIIGNVTIFGKKNGFWSKVLDLSACVNKELNLTLPIYVDDLKTKADTVESSALCFIPTINDEACSVILGQKNGSLLFWSLKVEDDENLKAYFQGSIENDFSEVKSILWIDKCDNKGIIVVSNLLGQVILYKCSVNNNIKMLNKHLVWPYRDNVVTQYLHHTLVDNKIVLIYDKHRHLVVQMLDDDYNVKSQYAENVNDCKISSIAVNSNEFLLATVNFQMFKISIDVSNDNLDVRLNLFKLKDSYNNYELMDIGLSQNNKIIAAVVTDISVDIRKRMSHVNVLFFTTDSNYDSNISFLLHNEVKSIINVWDAIELVRNDIVKSKALPITEIEKLFVDGETDIYKLKLYLVLGNICSSLIKNLKAPNSKIPEKVEKVKDKIMLKYAQLQLNDIHKLIVQNISSNFEIEVFIAIKKYLDYYSKKYNVKLGSLISPGVYNSVNEEKNYICQCCDNELEGFSCSSGHINMFCPITFLPIETSDYLVCVACGITARHELYDRKVKCIFCDKYLQKKI